MKISLRKANALQNAITEAIAGLDTTSSITLTEFENVKDRLDIAITRWRDNEATRSALLDAFYEVRDSVATANAVAGVNSRLATLARVEKDINWLNRAIKEGARLADEVISGRLHKIRERKEDSSAYFGAREDVVTTTIFTEADIEGFRANQRNLKKEKVNLQDALLELNVATTIELSARSVATLKSAGII